MAQPTRNSGSADIDTDAGACRIEMPDGTLRVEEADGRVNIYAGPRNQRRRIRAEAANGIEVHFYGGPAPARRYRMERKDNGTIEYFLPSETYRVNGRRFYAKWPNGRVDVFGGPDNRRSCVYSIHPDGRRDHYTGEAGKEVRTRIDCPVRGIAQILGMDGDREYIKETRSPRAGVRRVYNGKTAGEGHMEFHIPKSEPEWVAGSGATKVAALRKEYEQAWKPYLKLDAVQGALAMALAPSEHKKTDEKGRRRHALLPLPRHPLGVRARKCARKRAWLTRRAHAQTPCRTRLARAPTRAKAARRRPRFRSSTSSTSSFGGWNAKKGISPTLRARTGIASPSSACR